ncbi:hypothetical protein ABZ490_46060 [Streptomyces sp. NPDC005811]|uniref:hypothetical protein n=1 Tax=Streptomyces sp. NPDC005811 TaxID=3154565 RepID=UPI0033DD18B1
MLAARGSDTDLLIGSNLDEGSLYLAPLGILAGSTEANLHSTAAQFLSGPGSTTEDAVRTYRARHPNATTAELRTIIFGDGLFTTGTRLMAATHVHAASGRTYRYEFAWRSDTLDGQLGASHVMGVDAAGRSVLTNAHNTSASAAFFEDASRQVATQDNDEPHHHEEHHGACIEHGHGSPLTDIDQAQPRAADGRHQHRHRPSPQPPCLTPPRALQVHLIIKRTSEDFAEALPLPQSAGRQPIPRKALGQGFGVVV